ncbi:MAG: hypothetical protein HYR88_09180, partial [Verrucomicrobia bacterium]|nr:hypothetical protein [Verrucomicrobiota bacterium]
LYREFFARQGAGKVEVRQGAYHGWTNAVFLSSDTVEAVVVPEIGRVMQFRFKDEEGPFFENAELFGKTANPLASEWANFGGDKAWPSPQSDWPLWTPRAWPPPPAFDALPMAAELAEGRVLIHSAMDPLYNILVERTVRLSAEAPEMTIVTRFEKQAGVPAEAASSQLTNSVGIWIVTQLKDPVGVYLPAPKTSLFLEGYNRQSESLPAGLKRSEELVSLTRDPAASHKIGSDASSLVWVGAKVALRIDSPRSPGSVYPDQGSSAEVYTNPDPMGYVELEMLAPLQSLRAGDVLFQTNRYTLFRRTGGDPEAEAQRILRP